MECKTLEWQAADTLGLRLVVVYYLSLLVLVSNSFIFSSSLHQSHSEQSPIFHHERCGHKCHGFAQVIKKARDPSLHVYTVVFITKRHRRTSSLETTEVRGSYMQK